MFTPLVGAHMSIQGGFENALRDGEAIGCTAIQIFVHSNRQWHMKMPTPESITLFLAAQKKSSIRAVLVHASYLINLGSKAPDIRKKSIDTLAKELLLCSKLGLPTLILHPGSAIGTSPEEALELAAQGLDTALDAAGGTTTILLENTAGQGTALGATFEELAEIRKLTHQKKRVAFCFDTCHAFAAGYDFRTPETYKALLKSIDVILGLEHIQAIHLNDTKKGLGSHVDRHDDIGKGLLGLEAFRLILNDPKLKMIPKILETPKGDHPLRADARNLAVLRGLMN